MPYYDRIQQASWIAPSGDTFDFSFEELTRDVAHRVGIFEFSGVAGSLHQDKSTSGDVYPVKAIFHGPDYDLIADAFYSATKQTGPSFLIHPRWGRKRVQVLATTQRENLVTEGGQAILNVAFQETLEREFPKTGIASKSLMDAKKTDFRTSAANNYADNVRTDNLADENALEQAIYNSGTTIRDSLSTVASFDADILAEFNTYVNDIINNAGSYVDEPLEYAQRVVDSILVTAGIPGRIASKLLGYKAVITDIVNRGLSIPSIQNRNQIIIDELLGTSSIVAASDSVNTQISNASSVSRNNKGRAVVTIPQNGTGYTSREEIISGVLYLQENSNYLIFALDEYQEIYEDVVLSETYLQSVRSYVPTWEIVSTVIKAGLDASFSLPVKRVQILTKSHTILDLCNTFYSSVEDDILNYFIDTNKLRRQEIIMVPKGREVVFYE